MANFLRNFFLNQYVSFAWLLGLAICIITALLSYNADDLSFNIATSNPPSNFLGYSGSYFADLVFTLYGLSFWIVPLVILNRAVLNLKKQKLYTPLLSFIFTFIALNLCATALAQNEISKITYKYSGIIGNFLDKVVQNFGIPFYKTACFTISIIFFIISLEYDLKDYKNFYNLVLKITKKTLFFIWYLIKFISIAILKLKIKKGVSTQEIESQRNSENIFSTVMALKTPPEFKRKKLNVPGEQNSYSSINDSRFILPKVDLFNKSPASVNKFETSEQLKKNATELLNVLNDFGVKGEVIDINQGPVVTSYEFEPAAGTKSSRVIGLADDIARTLSALSTRIANIPGRNVLGIELPNKQRTFFYLKELIETKQYSNNELKLPIILGKDLGGKPCIVDLAKMPHLLVAGTTGSGKSVAINVMILSLLYKYSPNDCKFIMVDPKMLELSVYDNIPHLLTPVVTEPAKAVTALKWAVKEMENRYRLMSNLGVRNIDGYNSRILASIENEQVLERTVQTGFDPDTGKPVYKSLPILLKKLPYLVIIVDEMADLMLVSGKDIEISIQRLAQMARAAGIHLIMATQRPSVDVITGVIKANFPSRISFKVTSKIDSRTILGEQGAEQLLGMGDMLYMGNGSGIMRVHCPFVADEEVERVASYLKSQGEPEYVTSVIEPEEEDTIPINSFGNEGTSDNDLYIQAVAIVRRDKKISTSYIQRMLRIGYNKAATLVEKMEKEGIISAPSHTGKREILVLEE